MARKTFNPHSARFDKRLISRKQNVFNRGMLKDMEPSDLPYDAVASLINADGYKDAIKGRKGSKLWSDLELPSEDLYNGATFDLSIPTECCGILVSTGMAENIFTVDMVGKLIYGTYVVGGENIPYPLVITEINSGREVAVEVSSTMVAGDLDNLKLVGKINAYFNDITSGVEYYLIGTDIYAIIGSLNIWNKYTLTGGRISDSNSQFFKVKENIILNNLGGLFVLNDVLKAHYAWKANDTLPDYPLGDRQSYQNNSKYSDPSSYNYMYSYARLSGSIIEDRNSEDTFIELETPPYFKESTLEDNLTLTPPLRPMENQEDFFNVNAIAPIESVFRQSTVINFTDAKNFSYWVNLTEDELKPFLHCVFNSNTFAVYFDFGGCSNLIDVAKAFERGLYDVSSDFRAKYNANDDSFIFYNRNSENTFSFPGAVATDFELVNEGVLLASSNTSRMGVYLDYFRYPTTRKDITHYSVYRTKDISGHLDPELSLLDPTLVNNPNIYGWVGDIPVCGGYIGGVIYSSGGGTDILTVTNGIKTDIGLIGNSLTESTGETFAITDVKSDTEYYGTVSTAANLSTRNFYFGTDDTGTASKTVKEITTSDYTFTEDNIGDTIFWFDGTTSVIENVVSGLATTVDSDTKLNQGMIMTPTYRSYYDTVNDIVQNGYLRYWGLNTRFMRELPSTNIGAYDSGILMNAQRDSNEINYVDTQNFRNIGYYNKINQMNNKLETGIRCILVVNNLFCVLTANQTFNINPKQGKVIETEFGEFYTHLPDPFLVNGSIGTTHQFKWKYGDKGDVAIITSEPALRLFNGVEYQRDRSLDAVKNTELKLMNPTMIVSYSGSDGLLVWGYREK